MILRSYIRRYPEAQKNDPCTICGQSALGEAIFWHGYGANDPITGKFGHQGLVTHEGCYWDEATKGPAPYLTYGQVDSLNKAIIGKNKPVTQGASRFLSAVTIALRERRHMSFHGDDDPAIRLGPELVHGYALVLAHLNYPDHKLWRLREANCTTEWTKTIPAEQPRTVPVPIGTVAERSRQLMHEVQAERISQRPRLLETARRFLEQIHAHGDEHLQSRLTRLEHDLAYAGASVRWNAEKGRAEWQTYKGPWVEIEAPKAQTVAQ